MTSFLGYVLSHRIQMLWAALYLIVILLIKLVA